MGTLQVEIVAYSYVFWSNWINKNDSELENGGKTDSENSKIEKYHKNEITTSHYLTSDTPHDITKKTKSS